MAGIWKVRFKDQDLGVFDPDEIEIDHLMILEDRTGFTIVELVQQIQRGSAKAMQALVWFMQVQSGNVAAELFVSFKLGDFNLDPVEDELAEGKQKTDPPVAAIKAA